MELEAFVKKRENHEFSNGPTKWPDFLEFSKEFKQLLTQITKELEATLLMGSPGHYYLSWFVEKMGKYVYGNTSDVRHFSNHRRDNILVRTAKDEKDFMGGQNQYTTIRELKERLAELLW